jgi:hypothetical protein
MVDGGVPPSIGPEGAQESRSTDGWMGGTWAFCVQTTRDWGELLNALLVKEVLEGSALNIMTFARDVLRSTKGETAGVLCFDEVTPGRVVQFSADRRVPWQDR